MSIGGPYPVGPCRSSSTPSTPSPASRRASPAFEGSPTLIVNVASRCGLTPQYTGLEALQERYGDRGFNVVGFPCNQFGGQEPGTAEEIADVLLDDLRRDVPDDGEDRGQRPRTATRSTPSSPTVADAEGHAGDIRWNFEKFLVGKDGSITRFSPMVEPEDPALVAAIEAELD